MDMTDEDFLWSLGRNIRKLREEKSLTQFELSVDCNMEAPNLIRIEKGRTNPTVKTLRAIAKSLGVRVQDLFSFEGGPAENAAEKE